MNQLEITFWICAAALLYAYAGFPMLVSGLARLRGRPAPRRAPFAGSVSIVLAVHNEEANLARRLLEFADALKTSGIKGEIIVVSDGSRDGTADIARSHTGVQLVELEQNQGKAAALSAGCALAKNDILLFADARQQWAGDALSRLLENFADPEIGAVSGDLIIESSPGVLAGVSLYWRFEKWLRKQESNLHSTVGVTGAICAVRRELFRPIPPGTLLDDVYWPLQVAFQGYRVIHDERARALDRFPDRARDEFRRKIRTLSGNFQLITRLPALLVPWRNPLWLQTVSHKLLRLLAPWLLLAALAISAVLPGQGFTIAFWGQVCFYLVGLAGLVPAVAKRSRLAAAAGSFLVLNAAAWLAFWTWITGQAGRSWTRVRYQESLGPMRTIGNGP